MRGRVRGSYARYGGGYRGGRGSGPEQGPQQVPWILRYPRQRILNHRNSGNPRRHHVRFWVKKIRNLERPSVWKDERSKRLHYGGRQRSNERKHEIIHARICSEYKK